MEVQSNIIPRHCDDILRQMASMAESIAARFDRIEQPESNPHDPQFSGSQTRENTPETQAGPRFPTAPNRPFTGPSRRLGPQASFGCAYEPRTRQDETHSRPRATGTAAYFTREQPHTCEINATHSTTGLETTEAAGQSLSTRLPQQPT